MTAAADHHALTEQTLETIATLSLSGVACRIGWGVSEIWRTRKEEILAASAELADGSDEGVAAVAVILASLAVGPDVLRIASILSFDVGRVAACAGRLVDAAVWVGDSMIYLWLDKDELEQEAGLILDSLVAAGEVEKVDADKYRLISGGADG